MTNVSERSARGQFENDEGVTKTGPHDATPAAFCYLYSPSPSIAAMAVGKQEAEMGLAEIQDLVGFMPLTRH